MGAYPVGGGGSAVLVDVLSGSSASGSQVQLYKLPCVDEYERGELTTKGTLSDGTTS